MKDPVDLIIAHTLERLRELTRHADPDVVRHAQFVISRLVLLRSDLPEEQL